MQGCWGSPLLEASWERGVQSAGAISTLPAAPSSCTSLWLPCPVLTGSYLEKTFSGISVVWAREHVCPDPGPRGQWLSFFNSELKPKLKPPLLSDLPLLPPQSFVFLFLPRLLSSIRSLMSSRIPLLCLSPIERPLVGPAEAPPPL